MCQQISIGTSGAGEGISAVHSIEACGAHEYRVLLLPAFTTLCRLFTFPFFFL